jgi:hypothetical protein
MMGSQVEGRVPVCLLGQSVSPERPLQVFVQPQATPQVMFLSPPDDVSTMNVTGYEGPSSRLAGRHIV